MNQEKPRIGVYVCMCGSNIAGTVDVPAVVEAVGKLKNVVVCRYNKYTCSGPGQSDIETDIKANNLNRVVVSACSPRMHERTWRELLARAGLNPYLLEVANLREHCSWTHPAGELTTQKAIDLVTAAVERVALHDPLFPQRVPITRSAMVIGGGIAGIQASLDLARAGIPVYLVEREPSIGGHMAQLDKTFPTLDCSACILTPKMVDVGSHPKITLMSYSEVEKVEGFIGNFEVTVRRKARYVDLNACTACGNCEQACPVKKIPSEFDANLTKRKAIYRPFAQAVPSAFVIDDKRCVKCLKCDKVCTVGAIHHDDVDRIEKVSVGAVIVATGYDAWNPSPMLEYGYGTYPEVYTGIELERLSNASGPTEGNIVMRNGQTPKRVAILHCVGSRDEHHHPYCSRICCMYSLKLAHLIREKTSAEVYEFYMDIRSAGKGYEEFYTRVQHEGVVFVRGRGAQVLPEGDRLVVRAEDTDLGRPVKLAVDMVVLSTGMVPSSGAEELAHTLHISRDVNGFFLEAHPKLRPVDSNTDGIFVAGTCQAPRDIPDTVTHAGAAAAQALGLLNQEYVEVVPTVAEVRELHCVGCGLCVEVCPYGAMSLEEKRGQLIAKVNEALCKGCGLCVAGCRGKAISLRGFNDEQLLTQMETLLQFTMQ